MNNEILNLKICNRILEADGPLFSGESVNIRLAIDAGDSVAAKHKLVLFGFDKSALAESAAFSATENQGVWSSSINTATNEFAAYFRNIPANASKSVGAMIVNTETGDTITRGNIAVISTPFPSELTPAPTPFEFVSKDEMQAAINEAESSLSAEFESGLSSLASDVAGKADASTVDDLSSDVAALSADFSADLAEKADSSTVAILSSDVADLAAEVASKAESSTVAALSSAVGDASLLVRRSQYGGVGIGGEVKYITLTGADDEYPLLEFADEANGGDHYVFMPDGPAATGGDWHEIYLPNKDGTIALDTDLASKAESSTVAALSSAVGDLAARVAALEGRA